MELRLYFVEIAHMDVDGIMQYGIYTAVFVSWWVPHPYWDNQNYKYIFAFENFQHQSKVNAM